MKLLLTVEFYHPRVGGAEEVTRHIAEGLARRGHEVHVATSSDAARVHFQVHGVTIHAFDIWGNEVKGLRGETNRFREFLSDFDADVMFNYAAQSWPTDISMQEATRIRARRMAIATCGFSGLSTLPRTLAYWSYFRRMPERLRSYDLVVYHSGRFRDAQFGHRHGIRHSVVIPNGVALEEFARPRGRTRERLHLGPSPLLVNVSNHYRLKGHARFVRLARSLPNASLLLLGRNVAPRWQSCFEQCQVAARQGELHVLDGDRSAVLDAIVDADIVVSTSKSEVAPLVPLEAAAAGRPWLSFDVGDVRDLEGGHIVQDEFALREAVRHLLATPSEAESLGRAGLAFAQGRAWDRIVERYEAAFGQLIEQPRAE